LPPPSCTAILTTAAQPGPVAIIQLAGDVVPVLRAVTGVEAWPVERLRLVDLAGIDEGLACRVDEQVAQLMPHGGPRVVQTLLAHLEEIGVRLEQPARLDPGLLYPEAGGPVEAMALAALARAASPMAIDLLLDQPRRWRTGDPVSPDDRARSTRLDRLLEPPRVVLAGPTNVGKSTLSNALLGRSMSITLDRPGTTRDYTAGRIDLAGLVVTWHDTPGLRPTDDPIEARAIALSRSLIDRADLLVAMTDAGHEWPDLPRSPDLRVAGRCDLGRRADADLSVSATTGEGLPELARAVRDSLVPPDDLAHPGRWIFDDRLQRGLSSGTGTVLWTVPIRGRGNW
jgi:tRNA modification GTPase